MSAIVGIVTPALLAFAPPSDAGQSPGLIGTLFPFLAIFAVFYFLVFAPMKKKQRKHGEMIDALKAGDKVITNGGIYGTVVGVDDEKVQLKIADQVRIEISRSAVAGLQQAEGN